jgi:hypothetical protein
MCVWGEEKEGKKKRRETKMWVRKAGEVMYFSGTNFRGLQPTEDGTGFDGCEGIGL